MDDLLHPPPFPYPALPLGNSLASRESCKSRAEKKKKKAFVCPERTRPANAALGPLNSKAFRAMLFWVTQFGLSRSDHCSSGLEVSLALKFCSSFRPGGLRKVTARRWVTQTSIQDSALCRAQAARDLLYGPDRDCFSHNAGLLIPMHYT